MKSFKHERKFILRNARTVILNANFNVLYAVFDYDVNGSSAGGMLNGVFNYVAYRLRQPKSIRGNAN